MTVFWSAERSLALWITVNVLDYIMTDSIVRLQQTYSRNPPTLIRLKK